MAPPRRGCLVFLAFVYCAKYHLHEASHVEPPHISNFQKDEVLCEHSNKTKNAISEDFILISYNGQLKTPPRNNLDEEPQRERRFIKKNVKRETAIVGIPCQENIDCITIGGGAYCDATKRCDCLPAYVNIRGYCWNKRNPGETCQYQEQCTSVSPNTFCDPAGTCRCNNNRAPYRTADDDGPFCIGDPPTECPTNGVNPKLRDYDTGTDVRCGGAAGGVGLACRDKDSGIFNEINALMFNCMCQKGNVPGLPCATSEGFCCPTRAYTCIQQKDEGVFAGGTPTQRWWFNSVTSQCETFSYRGSYGNANNFLSKSVCESYCKTGCSRGGPLLYTTSCSATTPCAVGGFGVGGYTCNEGANLGRSLCCPTSAFICGPRGGIPFQTIPVVTTPDTGERTYNVQSVTRYYYDSGQSKCLQFTSKGYGGTFNNFQTAAECESFCAPTVCTNGEPLRDGGGNVVRCGAGAAGVCPTKYDCSTGGVCCPTTNFVCGLPQIIGGCSNFVERWWFNPKTRICEKFFYSGCQGNDNNFGTYQDCTTRCGTSTTKPTCPQGEAAKDSSGVNYIVCSGAGITTTSCPADFYCYYDGARYGCCPTRTKTCSLDTLDAGTACVTPVSRWYYNVLNRNCDQFTYNGCDGNSNNFATKIDCQDYCGVGGCPEGGEPFRDTFNGNYRVCGVGGSECPSGYKCNVVTLGTSVKYNYCCPTRASVCLLPQDQGQRCGSSTLQRYYFNAASRTCEMFTYNGCGGNRNNFANVDQCLMYCNSAGCPPGQVALQDAGTRRVTTCDVSSSNCPSNYRCVLSTVLNQGICCGSSAPPGACPSGQIAYMDSFSNMPLQCQPNVDGSCPNGIFCQYSFALLNSFCCSTAAVQCPQGGDPYMDNFNQPRQCTPGLANSCPAGYQCQATTVTINGVVSTTGYCCGQSSLCGAGYIPYYVNNQPVPCILNQAPSTCPAPYACRQNVNSQQSYCCTTSSQQTPVCTGGKQPYLVQGAPTLCTVSSPSTACPPGYACELYQSTGSYYCCGTAVVQPPPPPPPPTSACPAPFALLQPVRTCSPGVTGSCPTNYFCNYDSTGLRYVCCGSGTPGGGGGGGGGGLTNYCPVNSQPYLNPRTGQPQVCVLGSPTTGCPTSYRCSYSNTYRNYYCCSGTTGGGGPPPPPPPPPGGTGQCPAGLVPFITGAGQPQTCVLGTSTCPVNYQCTNVGRSLGLCCGRSTGGGGRGGDPYGCPAGNAYLYPGTRTPLACTRGGRPCPTGYTCLQSTKSSALQCCSNTSTRQGAIQNENLPSVPQPVPVQNPSPSIGQKKCSSNFDCRDNNGRVTLCRSGVCMQ